MRLEKRGHAIPQKRTCVSTKRQVRFQPNIDKYILVGCSFEDYNNESIAYRTEAMPSLSKNAGKHRSIHAMRVATIRQVAPAQRAQKSAKAREVKLQFSASARATLKGGVSKVLKFNDIPLTDLL